MVSETSEVELITFLSVCKSWRNRKSQIPLR